MESAGCEAATPPLPGQALWLADDVPDAPVATVGMPLHNSRRPVSLPMSQTHLWIGEIGIVTRVIQDISTLLNSSATDPRESFSFT
jgi:hypothetical protein